MHTALSRSATTAAFVLAFASLAAGCGAAAPSASRPPEAEQWYRRAQREFVGADFDEAHDSVNKALGIVRDDPEVRLLAAEIALTSLDYAEVVRLLKGVPGTQASRLRGRALWYKGELEAAADQLEEMLNDPEVNDPWAKGVSKLAHNPAGRIPFEIRGGLIGAVEMVHVSPVAPYFVVPLEIDGEAALAMITTGSGEVVVDSATRPEPSWVSLRFDHLEIHDVPALAQDLSGISKEIGAPIKAMLGVNLLRHLNATLDYRGHQFVARSFAPPPPPAATRLDLHYARGGAIVVRSALGASKESPRAALLVDTSRPFFLALDEAGWKKAGIDPATLRLLPGDPEQKLREGMLPLLNLGAFPITRVSTLFGVPFTDLEKATAIDLDGIIGASLLYPYRCTFADEGRVLWIEDDLSVEKMISQPPQPSQPSQPSQGPASGGLLPPASPPVGPVNEREAPAGPKPVAPAPLPPEVARPMSKLLAVYAGSFDPVTLGHLDLIERSGRIFDEVVVAVGRHATKKAFFTHVERVELIREVTRDMTNVRVESFEGLLIHFCERIGARVIVRGLRAATDFEYELQIAHANADMVPRVDTVFLPTRTNYGFVSASLVREIASHGGDVSHYAPPAVCAALVAKIGERAATASDSES